MGKELGIVTRTTRAKAKEPESAVSAILSKWRPTRQEAHRGRGVPEVSKHVQGPSTHRAQSWGAIFRQ